jgi:hypothetical protein
MAGELNLLPNPDNVPGAVSSGYQRQNTNLFVLQTGVDTTEPYDDGEGIITIPSGGIVELNGSIFKITQNVSIIKPTSSGQYFIGVEDNNDGTGSFVLLSIPGVFDHAKNAYYNNGKRILNWVSNGRPTIAIPSTADSSVVASLSGYQTQYYSAKKGWYRGILKAAGGGNGNNGGTGGAGGSVDIFFFLHKSTSIKLMSSSAGSNGTSGSSGSSTYRAGGGGGGGTVIDLIYKQFIANGGGGGASGSGSGGGVGYNAGGGGGGYGGGGAGYGGMNTIWGNGGDGGGSIGSKHELIAGGGPSGGGCATGNYKGSGAYSGNGGESGSSGGPGGNNVDNILGGGATATTSGSLILQYFE